MISKIADWYRIAESKPDDPTIEKRKLAILGVVKKISESDDIQLVCGLVSAAVSGTNPKNDSQKQIIELMMGLLCEHQPSLPTDPNENTEIIRACAIVALGEIVAEQEGKTGTPSDLSVLVCSLLQTSIGLRSTIKERIVQKVLTELIDVAQSTLQMASETKRRRQSALNKFDKIPADADVKKVLDVAKLVTALLEEQMKIDREELETLWWLRGGYSNILRKPIAEIDVCSAAVVCAMELADRCLLPPPESVREMVSEAVSNGRVKKQMIPIRPQTLLTSVEPAVSPKAVIDSEGVKKLVVAFPDIFPISSFLLGETENALTSKKGKPSLPVQEISPLVFARQAFNERISQRLINNMV